MNNQNQDPSQILFYDSGILAAVGEIASKKDFSPSTSTTQNVNHTDTVSTKPAIGISRTNIIEWLREEGSSNRGTKDPPSNSEADL